MISYLPNPTIERVIPGKFVGDGIKKTPAYEVLITKEEHDKWKAEFWVSSITSRTHEHKAIHKRGRR